MDKISGVCRVCGCTENSPCILTELNDPDPDRQQFGCAWIDLERTLCSNPRCVAMIPLELLLIATMPPLERCAQ